MLVMRPKVDTSLSQFICDHHDGLKDGINSLGTTAGARGQQLAGFIGIMDYTLAGSLACYNTYIQ